MVLDYWGIKAPYHELVNLLGTKWFGTPFRSIKQVERFGVSVSIERLSLAEIKSYLEAGGPVIACVHTSDLGYWRQAVDHVVVVVGVDEMHVYVNDPSLGAGAFPVPSVEFELAQLNYDNLCAVVMRS